MNYNLKELNNTQVANSIEQFFEYYKKGGSIHIKEQNKGKFTDYCGGKVTNECINKGKNSPSSTIRKRATFAANSRKWKHENGGNVHNPFHTVSVLDGTKNVDRKTLKLKKHQQGGNIQKYFAKYETLDPVDIEQWSSPNPLSTVNSVRMPETPKIKSETQTPEEKQNFKVTYVDYEKPSNPKITENEPITGNDNVSKAFNFFMSKGLTREQAGGFIGNFLAESQLNPQAINKEEKSAGLSGYGRGIAQWSNDRIKNFEKLYNKKIEDSSLEEQLNFAWHEMEQRPVFLNALRNAKNSDEASELVYRGFENGGANALATPKQLQDVYSRAWKNLGYRDYVYADELQTRKDRARAVLSNRSI